jgi:hypothetical protein
MNDFETWWYQEGSAFRPVDEDIEEFAKRMCKIAWSNGAFKAGEQAAKIAEKNGWHVTAAQIRKEVS